MMIVLQTIDEKIWAGKLESIPDFKLPVETSLAVYTDCSLGRKTYTNQKKILDAAGQDIPCLETFEAKASFYYPQ